MGCCWFAHTLRRTRAAVLAVALALVVGACGQVGVSNSGGVKDPTGVPTPGGPSPSPTAPSISGTPASSVVVGQNYSFVPTASDPNGATLTFSIANQPSWATFDAVSGQLSGSPSAGNVGTYANIVITASNGQASADLPAFEITVLAPLTISGNPPLGATVGSAYSFQPTTDAAPGSALTFSVQNLPTWASFDTSSGALTGTPTQTGTYAGIVISVTDGVQSASLPGFAITVTTPAGNSPPSISGVPPSGVAAGSAYSFTPTASDPNGLPLTFSVQNLPGWAAFSTATGTITGTPTAAQVGTYGNIVISVSDGTLSASLPAFAIKVEAALTISGAPAGQVIVGKSYSFQPSTNAPAGTKLSYSIKNRPAWTTFSAASGLLSGSPSAGQTGKYSNIIISVSDGIQSVSLAAFSIQVVAPLTISGAPPTQVVAGKSYAFQPTTNAAAGTALTFSIQNKPSWASFNAGTGALTGTPTAAQVGNYPNIGISVSDGTQSAALGAFSIAVTAASGPTISGTPPKSINAGSAYAFTPTTTNPSGNTLTFSIQNKPAWAAFNTATGALTGTPTAASVGTYLNILISVSDGTNSASLPAFSIAVNQASNGSATLNWTAVTQNTDGTVLTDLAGYHIHYGTSAGNMSTVVTLNNASLTTYLVTNLSSGTWYFGVSAYSSTGVEGMLSNVGSKTIPY